MSVPYQRLPGGFSVIVGKLVYIFESKLAATEFCDCLENDSLGVCLRAAAPYSRRDATAEELRAFEAVFPGYVQSSEIDDQVDEPPVPEGDQLDTPSM